jgi:hypothetical protein
MSAVNHITVAGVFNEAMQTLWPDGVKFGSVLLLVTDAAPYMKKAAEGLSVSKGTATRAAFPAGFLRQMKLKKYAPFG